MKKFIIFSFTLISFVFWSSECFALTFYSKKISTIIKQEPSFHQILQEAYKIQQIHPDDFERLQKKVKRAAWLPTLYVGYDHLFQEAQSLGVSDNISISGGTVTIGPADNDYDFDEDRDRNIRVRAVWKLDELVYNHKSLDVMREKRNYIRLKSELTKHLYTVYEQRYLFLLKYFQLKSRSRLKADAFYSKYLLLTSQLDALTGEVFQNHWWHPERNKK